MFLWYYFYTNSFSFAIVVVVWAEAQGFAAIDSRDFLIINMLVLFAWIREPTLQDEESLVKEASPIYLALALCVQIWTFVIPLMTIYIKSNQIQ